jgi:hypothetical protein
LVSSSIKQRSNKKQKTAKMSNAHDGYPASSAERPSPLFLLAAQESALTNRFLAAEKGDRLAQAAKVE